MKHPSLIALAVIGLASSNVALAAKSGAIFDSKGNFAGSFESDPDGMGGTFNDRQGNFAGDESKQSAHTATFLDVSGNVVETEQNGKFLNSKGQFIGKFTPNPAGGGSYTDKNGNFYGKIDSSGKVYNKTGQYIGTVPSDNEEAGQVMLKEGYIDDEL